MFVFSPLVGTPLTTSAKFAVVAKSPLTGRLTDALASSHFAIAGKLTGHDAIVLRGACQEPSVVVIDRGSVQIEPAADLWGLPAAEAEARLRDRHGPAWRVAAIGPAGERGVRYATISHDGRHAGRGGLGAVMGSKWCKAILVRAGTKVASADPAGVLAAAKDLRERSFGAATAKYRELGTMANLLAFNAISTLPTRNFSAARFDGAPALGAEEIAELRQVARNSCASCSIGCEHIYRGPGGKKTRMEYENVFALGPLCGVSDADAVIAASSRCDELGLDTISTGGTIAWAMECVEKGLIDAPWLRFGDGDALMRAIEEIGAREGLGELLRPGSRAASQDGRPRVGGVCRARQGPRAARVRAADAPGDGARARGQRPRRRPQSLRRLRGRPVRRPRPPRRRRASRRRRDRDREPRSGDGLADPVQVPARGVRGPVPGMGEAARDRSPAGTSTRTSSPPPRAGSCWPSGCSTCARVGRARRTGSPIGSCPNRSSSSRAGPRR